MAFSWTFDGNAEGWFDSGNDMVNRSVHWQAADGDPDMGCLQHEGSTIPPFWWSWENDAWAEVAVVPGGIIGAGDVRADLKAKAVVHSPAGYCIVHWKLRFAGWTPSAWGWNQPPGFPKDAWTAVFGVLAGHEGDIIDAIRIQMSYDLELDLVWRYDSIYITGATEESGGFQFTCDPGAVASGYKRSYLALAVAADGETVYVAAIDSATGFPVLIKAANGLPGAAWTKPYDPGAGSTIHVLCGNHDALRVLICGDFGVPKVRASYDAAASWITKDPAWAGVTRVLPMAIQPIDDDYITVTTADQLDVEATLTGGLTWTQLNAAIPFSAGAFALLDVNPSEAIIGRIAAGASRVQYTPNAFAEFHDLTAGTPNFPVTSVIVG